MTNRTKIAALTGLAGSLAAGAAQAHPTDGHNDVSLGLVHALSHGEHIWSLAGIIATLVVAGVISFKLFRKGRKRAVAEVPQRRD